MKKILFVIAVSFISIQSLDAQRQEYSTNYTSWLNLLDEHVYKTTYKGEDLVVRQYNKEGYIEWEIIKLDDNQYYYHNHDEDAKNGLISGELMIKDTSYLKSYLNAFNNTTQKMDTIFIYERPMVKHGEWHERTENYVYQGFYENGLRTGIWSKTGVRAPYLTDHQTLTYENGKIIDERQLNFIRTNNKDTILHYLCDIEWNSMSPLNKGYVTFSKGKEMNSKIELLKNGTLFLRSIKHSKTLKGTWSLENNLKHLVLHLDFATATFDIEELTETYLKLKKLK